MLKKIIAISLFITATLSSCATLNKKEDTANDMLYASYCDDANSDYYHFKGLTYEISPKERETRVYVKDLELLSLSSYDSEYDLKRYAESVTGVRLPYSQWDFLLSCGLTLDKESKEAIYWGKWNGAARYNV